MSRVDHALSLFQKKDNCSQAVLATYADRYGLDVNTAFKIAEVFSGGIAHSGNICGALNGALMVIGLQYGGKIDSTSAPNKSATDVAEMVLNKFKDRHGTYLCRELINFDLTSPENLKLAYEKKVFRNCPNFVASTIEFLEEVLEKPD
ncbi:MAG: C-GCAxxG-C-C family protein [Candidatus Hodarchaeales archaeon]|jgi:C_GCAxxG_C_C family probable redox protein